MKRYLLLILILSIMTPVMVMAQRTATVEGSYTYVVGENDNITLREAKLKCVEGGGRGHQGRIWRTDYF